MKVVFAMWHTGLAGGTRAIFEVANRLAGRGHEVSVVALGAPMSGLTSGRLSPT